MDIISGLWACSLTLYFDIHMSDDFSEPVKRALMSRAGNRCSNPDCCALTSGPQEDPAKAVNLGVAAHVTAASLGGPRYDAKLLPEERSAPSNGIWLCQNCAKLVDNDPVRFTVDLLFGWKSTAESDARNRVGKAAASGSIPSVNLHGGIRIRIEPIVPRKFERSEWLVQSNSGTSFIFQKIDSMATVEIPISFIENVHPFREHAPVLVQLDGRLQWITVGQRWLVLSEKPRAGPHNEHGYSKFVDFDYPRRMAYSGEFAWCREDRLAECLSRGRYIFYDEDGRYLRVPGPDVDQILVSSCP
jgi:hypothetical protein